MSDSLRICLISAEVAPFAKTGGLGDVCGALARYLHRAGHDVRLFMPFYSKIDRRDRHFHPVSFLRDVPIRMGARTLSFSGYSTTLPDTQLPIYLLHCPLLFDREGIYTQDADEGVRFAFLTRAAIESCQRMGWGPQVFHVHDWHTALLPLYLRTVYAWDTLFQHSKTLLTIHNIGYQGVFRSSLLGEAGLGEASNFLYQEDLAAGAFNFLKTGILYAGALSTVSRTHAEELQTDRYGMGLQSMLRARGDHLFGIVNGIDDDIWDPARDSLLPATYSKQDLSGKGTNRGQLLSSMGLEASREAPVVGIVSRLTSQKGFDLLFDVGRRFLAERDLRLVVLGNGEPRYEEFFGRLQHDFPGRAVFYRGYSEKLAHLVEAGADMFLMPSVYEPCGLNQMYSQRYGTPPIVRKTGGLADTVEPYNPTTGGGTGFVFEHYTPEGLSWAWDQALSTFRNPSAWHRLMVAGMSRDFSWETQIREYERVYEALISGRL